MAHEWLSELIFYGLYRWLGMRGLALLGAASLGVLCWFVARYLKKQGVPFLGIVLTLLVVLWGVLPRFKARPDIFDFALLPVALYAAEIGQYGWLGLVSLLWANLHGGSVPALFLAVAPKVIGLLRRRDFRGAVTLTGVTVLPVAMNPFGLHMYWYPFEVSKAAILRHNIAEWLSLQFDTWWGLLYLASVLFAVRCARAEGGKMLAILAFAVMGFVSARNIPLFFVAALPLAAPGVPWQRKKTFLGSLTLPLLMIALVAAAVFPGKYTSAGSRFPVEAAKRIVPGERVFNAYGWGGYLINQGIPVFIDGRADIYVRKVFPDYLKAVRTEGWRQVFEEYRVETVLVERQSGLAIALREAEGWRLDYEDDLAVIFRWKGEAHVVPGDTHVQ